MALADRVAERPDRGRDRLGDEGAHVVDGDLATIDGVAQGELAELPGDAGQVRRSTSPSVTRLPRRSAISRAAPGPRRTPCSRASCSIQPRVGRGAIAPTMRPPAATTASTRFFGDRAPSRPSSPPRRRRGHCPARPAQIARSAHRGSSLRANEHARVATTARVPPPNMTASRRARRSATWSRWRGSAQVPALERGTRLGGEGGRAADRPRGPRQVVVAPEPAEGRGHAAAARPGELVARRAERIAGPGQTADVVGRDARRATDVRFEPRRPRPHGMPCRCIPGVGVAPRHEANRASIDSRRWPARLSA